MISVVDDEAPVRKALGRLLRAAGFDVETFASGREFLDSLDDQRPDCTILDLHLPELSGLDVQQRLAEENIPLPCIVITGKDEPGVAERVLAHGAVAYLKKPLDAEALLAAITAAVPEHAAQRNTQIVDFERGKATGTQEIPTDEGRL
jgi:FixJ family two-component response regulator